jgi:hypothetical protein
LNTLNFQWEKQTSIIFAQFINILELSQLQLFVRVLKFDVINLFVRGLLREAFVIGVNVPESMSEGRYFKDWTVRLRIAAYITRLKNVGTIMLP